VDRWPDHVAGPVIVALGMVAIFAAVITHREVSQDAKNERRKRDFLRKDRRGGG
jgi:hypothetical protein